jgi:hypothetical protein
VITSDPAESTIDEFGRDATSLPGRPLESE